MEILKTRTRKPQSAKELVSSVQFSIDNGGDSILFSKMVVVRGREPTLNLTSIICFETFLGYLNPLLGFGAPCSRFMEQTGVLSSWRIFTFT